MKRRGEKIGVKHRQKKEGRRGEGRKRDWNKTENGIRGDRNETEM